MNRYALKLIAATLLCAALINPAAADEEHKFCAMINQVADGGMLKTYSDEQIENGLCMTSKILVFAISNDEPIKQEVCTSSATYIMAEFKKRFPNRSASEVIGRC